LLYQDTQASGVVSPTPPAVALSHDDDATAAAHTLVAAASGAPESTGKQPSTGIGLASSSRMPPAIPTVLGAARYVMGMKSLTERELRGGRAPDATRCAGRPEGALR
jgi:hypothetical protein